VVRVFVRHRVADYPAWRAVYDGFDQQRRELGVTGHAAYQALSDPNEVTVWHDFSTREAAESFASSPQLREVMQQAGVQGQPDIWFTNPA
jgi:quinol monooxygenase YgiN